MNEPMRPHCELGRKLPLRQTVEVDAEQVRRMVADHYSGVGLPFHHSHVDLRVHGSSGGGFSSTAAGFDGATIRFPEAMARRVEEAGMPTTLELTAVAVASLVAKRVGDALRLPVATRSVAWDVMDAGGSGFGSHAAALQRARIVLSLQA